MTNHLNRRRSLQWMGAAALAGTLAAPALAQSGKTIRLLVGFPAGGGTDAIARLLAERLKDELGANILVENKPGAGGQLAAQALKAATPDGSVYFLTHDHTVSILPLVVKNPGFDTARDFVPVAGFATFANALALSGGTPAKSVAEYVAWVKSNPQKNGFYGSAAPGSIPHFFGVMFGRTAGLELTHVPYKGTAAAMQALAGQEITALSTVVADIRTLVQADRARLLAVAGDKRDPALPSVPTFRELGYDLVATPWYALFAPAGTPPAALERLSKAALAAVTDPALNKRMVEMGIEPTGHGPDRLGQILKADHERWGAVIKASGFKPAE